MKDLSFLSASSEEVVFLSCMSTGSRFTLSLHFAGATPTSRSRRNANSILCQKHRVSFFLAPLAVAIGWIAHTKTTPAHTHKIWLSEDALKALVITKCAGFLLRRLVEVPPLCVWMVDARRGSATKRIADQLQLDSTWIQQSTKSPKQPCLCPNTAERRVSFSLPGRSWARNYQLFSNSPFCLLGAIWKAITTRRCFITGVCPCCLQ